MENKKHPKYSALTHYINNCLHILHWNELLELFLETFSTPNVNFSNIKFKFGDNFTEYTIKRPI